jgi:hypothetical protein
MAFSPIAVPNILTSPGALYIAPLGTALIASTVAASVFSIDWSTVPAWLPLGATEDGSEFSYQTTVSPIDVAEFVDPIQFATTGRSGSIAFALANYGASNYQRALNNGVAAATPTAGTGVTASYDVTPAPVGNEIRCMIGWESLDHTARLYCYQTIQGGDIKTAYKKAPSKSLIPCTFQMEIPTSGIPFRKQFAGNRG